MELNIFTCVCLLDHLIMMRNESEKKIVTKIFLLQTDVISNVLQGYILKIIFFLFKMFKYS